MELPRFYRVVADALEFIGVAVIAIAFIGGMARALRHFWQDRAGAYEFLKSYIGRALLLGLEFLVAADIVRTIMIETTIRAVLALGLLILVRTVLSWSVVVEIEGCWPWQMLKYRPKD